MSTTVSPETKLLRTLNRIQYCSPNGYSLIRELQQGMNNFRNTLTAFNKIVANKRQLHPVLTMKPLMGSILKN
ncbi:MAG: hypothetical protein Q8839_01780 [Candidatus Phytoplasma australasiaticum]|nr:hypothetical protein [Candidatus Phytoplasma australasiaticum]MDV3153524.1 hypothetical protein [Candidatus Phytoplasma australasiaticum]MDV3167636.1 hypothetical protein [Candidatus Phytoplasma australasiaticum]MDV3180731.1 hypothetical protein [Candidatus Phytoplasma australasiaticum]MDV3182978.1 hypothetical protein [Candidatus Phytoplasma australasiaticum]